MAPMAPSVATPKSGSTIMAILLTAVLTTYCAQQVLMPALAPFARETGLSETELGAVLGMAAVFLVVASPLWGKRCQTAGPRAIMFVGLTTATLGLIGFAVTAEAALDGRLSSTATFVLAMATRGVVFGAGLAAVPVAVISYVASVTTPDERTAGMGKVGAAQGLAIVLGPAVGGALSFLGLMGPVWSAPVFVAAALILVMVGLPRPRTVEAPKKRASLRPWDPRVRTWLLVSFCLYSGLGFVLLTVGFAVQDKGHLSGSDAAQVTGVITFSSGLVIAAIQGVAVPRVKWSPRRLLLTGLPCALVGFIILTFATNTWLLGVGMVAMAAGFGFSAPGYISGATLSVDDHEQPAVAGLVTSATGTAFVVGPALGGWLYSIAYEVPFVTAAVAAVAALTIILLDKPQNSAKLG